MQIGNQIIIFNHVENLLDKEQSDYFFSILANPAAVDHTHTENLERLVNAYPQVAILRALLARANKGAAQPLFEQKLKTASAYAADRAALFNIVNQPQKLTAAGAPQLMFNYFAKASQAAPAAPVPTEAAAPATPTDQPGPVNALPHEAETFSWENAFANAVVDDELHNQPTVVPAAQNEEAFDEDKYLSVLETQIPRSYTENTYLPQDADAEPAFDEQQLLSAIGEEAVAPALPETEAAQQQPVAATAAPDAEQQPSAIDDEVFDEITGIDDISIEPVAFKLIVEDGVIPRDNVEIPATVDDDDAYPGLVLHEAVIDENEPPQPEPAPEVDEQKKAEDQLIAANIVATDYFEIGSRFTERMAAAQPREDADEGNLHEEAEPQIPGLQPQAEPVLQAQTEAPADNSRVSMYHDDKMPYSFMWWLDKTRREHAALYQPYAPYRNVNAKMIQPEQAAPPELQQQYFENIFHGATIDSFENVEPGFNPENKEDIIIERFIREEPQIKPPSNDRLDNENKAKKSSEDQDELVSETLARIYTEQMLYHKAITTYKKLLLKFPEKSSYFVAQIKLLERKIN